MTEDHNERAPEPVDLPRWRAADAYTGNRLLFDWLSSDEHRAEFYRSLKQKSLPFHSRAPLPAAAAGCDPVSSPGHREVHLVLDRQLIHDILRNEQGHYSNLPYAAIGSGNFMLALDADNPAHAEQRRLLETALANVPPGDMEKLCGLAVSQAMLLALQRDTFDVAALAEQAAVRWSLMLYGFAPRDQLLVEAACRAGYDALLYINLGRHFATEPGMLPKADAAMGALARRAAELIDEYTLRQAHRWPEDGMAPPGMDAFEPVMRRLPRLLDAQAPLTGEQLAVVVVGAIAGTVGNIQAATCIALDALLREPDATSADPRIRWQRVADAWKANPPVPFLPRRVARANAHFAQGDELVLALGAALQRGDCPAACPHDPLIFGGSGYGLHECTGAGIGAALVSELLGQVLALPALARRIDSVTGAPLRLKKRWGFQCLRLPLTYRRDRRLLQQPLNVAMRVKAPISENAAKLRETIRVAAPRIEHALRQSKHVHFAWFEFFDNDATLVLHTVYDGDFAAYIEHFALNVGDLFDQLFLYIEPAPPSPVKEHPFEFIELIARFNRPPATGYFFSAYPTLGADACTRHEAKWRQT